MATKKTKLTIASWVAAAALGAGVVGATVATAGTHQRPGARGAVAAGAQVADQTGKPPHGRRGRLGRLARGVVHGEFTVKTKQGFLHVVVARGEVVAVSPTSITVKSADGVQQSFVVDASTKVRKNRAPAHMGDVHKGDKAAVVATDKGGAMKARVIRDGVRAGTTSEAPAA
jgi:hypothetical protein